MGFKNFFNEKIGFYDLINSHFFVRSDRSSFIPRKNEGQSSPKDRENPDNTGSTKGKRFHRVKHGKVQCACKFDANGFFRDKLISTPKKSYVF